MSLLSATRKLCAAFVNAVRSPAERDDAQADQDIVQDIKPPEMLAAQYVVFLGFDKGFTLRPETDANKKSLPVIRATGAIITARAVRGLENGLWSLQVSADGRMSLSDDNEPAMTSGGILHNDYILPFEDRLTQQGFCKVVSSVARVFRTTSFEKTNLSDHEVAHAFSALDAMMAWDDRVINLDGTRHDVREEYRVTGYDVPVRRYKPVPPI